MDYNEEQSMEIEALESILMDDLKIVSDGGPGNWNPTGNVYKVPIVPQSDDGEPLTADDAEVGIEVMFAHTASYPEEAPLIKISSIRGLSKQEIEEAQEHVDSQIEENLGMPMIYTLVTVAQEWMNDVAAKKQGSAADPDAERKKMQEEEERRISELRAHGTPVTPESFEKWKHDFDEEMRSLKQNQPETVSKTNKMTGKQWFLQQDAQHIKFEEPDIDDAELDTVISDSDTSLFDDSDEEDVLDSYLAQVE